MKACTRIRSGHEVQLTRVLAGVLLFLSATSQATAAGIPSDRPNILWLVVEDMSPWLPCYGDETVPTPNLDRFAAQSIRYTQAFASSPVCAPARSSLITGMYATRIGTMHMRTGKPSAAAVAKDPEAYASIPSYEGVPPDFVRCFPEHLRAAGYYCTNASKTDYQFRAPATVWDQSNGKAHWRKRPEGAPFFAVFNHGGTHESQAFPDAKRRPVAVTPEDVPIPPLYPDTEAVRDAMARTYNNIAAMDVWVGQRLAELDEAGLADDTVVFFYSDHGVGLPRGKRSPYDLGTRVPLLVRLPDGSDAGTDEERVVSFVDFGPSVLSLTGIEPDKRLDGIAFLGPFVREGSGFAFTHADRFDGVYDKARSVSDGRYRYVRNLQTDIPHLIGNAYRERIAMTQDLYDLRPTDAAHATRWQTASTKRPAEELYDSQSDPWELSNQVDAPEMQQTLLRLRAALDGWVEDTGDLGLLADEQEMVAAHLWPDLKQPATAPIEHERNGDVLHLSCQTEGASIGYRTADGGAWSIYSNPISVESLKSIEVLAHRIGYSPAKRRIEL
ncbi:MAG: N-sulfoglucosamine sulfohydrolase [Planctomycetota bacterium]|jgi:N-sulfoglucosamine sulfohydrolase